MWILWWIWAIITDVDSLREPRPGGPFGPLTAEPVRHQRPQATRAIAAAGQFTLGFRQQR
jgi:hypothetical protein